MMNLVLPDMGPVNAGRLGRQANRSPRVILAHPGRQHSYETVLAAQDAGMLQRFIASYYWRGDRTWTSRIVRTLPGPLRARLSATLRKRWHPDIDPSLVSIAPWFHVIARLVAAMERAAPRLPSVHPHYHADWEFDRLVGRWLSWQPTPDIVHAFEGSGLHTLQAARRLGAVAALDVPSAHEYYLQVLREGEGNIDERWFGSIRARVRAERQVADWLFAPSAYVKQCLTQNGVPESRIVPIPYGADATRFKPRETERQLSSSRSPFRALFVGQLTTRKGIRYLLEAWKSLDLPNSELVVAGGRSGVAPALLKQCHGTCRLIGNVPWHTVHELFESADVFVFPTLAEGSA